MTKPTVAVDAEYLKEIEKARRELRALISAKNCAPLMLRLACHDAGTYDADTRTGGPNGSIKSKDELNHKANKGLEEAVEFCEKVKEKCPKITYADLYQLAGVVAVEVTGGPTIDFVPGRKDSLGTPTLARLPDADQDAQQLREVFHRMGLSDDKDIVALSVCYTLGGAGFEGPWTSNPPKFDNSYFKELLPPEKAPGQSLPADKPEAPLHTDKPEAPLHTDKPQAPLHTDKPQAPLSTDKRQAPPPTAKPRDLLPIEKALLDDREFHKHVERYAKDEDAFFKDYAASHKKLSELGFKLKHVGDHRVMHGVIGLFIASTVAILGYLFQVKRSSKRGDYY